MVDEGFTPWAPFRCSHSLHHYFCLIFHTERRRGYARSNHVISDSLVSEIYKDPSAHPLGNMDPLASILSLRDPSGPWAPFGCLDDLTDPTGLVPMID